MGRLLFGSVLAIVGLLYLGAAVMSVFGSPYGPRGFLDGNYLGPVLFLVVGLAAFVASVSLLREKRR
ncbi:MAG: hypothetical protein ACR2M0_04045 [Chloroflexia bacterium]